MVPCKFQEDILSLRVAIDDTSGLLNCNISYFIHFVHSWHTGVISMTINFYHDRELIL